MPLSTVRYVTVTVIVNCVSACVRERARACPVRASLSLSLSVCGSTRSTRCVGHVGGKIAAKEYGKVPLLY